MMQCLKRLQRVIVAGIVVVMLALFPLRVWGQGPDDKPLFEDDFSTYSSRWLERESPKATVAYNNNDKTLLLRVVSPGVGVWSVPDFQVALAEYDLTATINFHGGGPDAQGGVVLASADDDAFLAVLVTRSGAWQIARFDSGEWIDLTPDDAAPVSRADDSDSMLLRVEVRSDTIVLWIDEQPTGIVSIETANRPGTGFGVIARAGRDYVEVAVDDVVVREVTEEPAS
jgi:hypothetical protein